MSPLRRTLGYSRPYVGRLAATLGTMLAATAVGLAYPMVVRLVFDRVVLGGDTEALPGLALRLAGLAVLGFAAGATQAYLYTSLSARVLLDLRAGVFDHLQRLPLQFFRTRKLGDVVARIGGDVAEIQNVATGALLSLVSLSLTLAGTVVLLALLDARLLLASLALVPLALLVGWFVRPPVERLARTVREENAEVGSIVLESTLGAETVRATTSEAIAAGRFRRANERLVSAVLRFQVLQSAYAGSLQLVVAANTLVVLTYGATRAASGAITWGTLVAFLVYVGRLYGPVQGLAGLWLSLRRASASAARVFELLDTPASPDRPDGHAPPRVEGRIRLRGVCVEYEPGRTALGDLDLDVAPGETVAIVGPNGSGKTTLLRAILGLEPIARGSVEIDGVALDRWSLASLRRRAALVTEEAFLFRGTVDENVRLGRPDASVDDVARAIRVAGAAGLVGRLPDRERTIVGERGATLSAGERQRVSLARAILREPSILLLDDPFGQIDTVSDEEILAAIRPLMAGRTTILATHREKVARSADRVIILDSGPINSGVESHQPRRGK